MTIRAFPIRPLILDKAILVVRSLMLDEAVLDTVFNADLVLDDLRLIGHFQREYLS